MNNFIEHMVHSIKCQNFDNQYLSFQKSLKQVWVFKMYNNSFVPVAHKYGYYKLQNMRNKTQPFLIDTFHMQKHKKLP